jgi:hypothetical protein
VVREPLVVRGDSPVILGGQQKVSKETALQKLYQALNK